MIRRSPLLWSLFWTPGFVAGVLSHVGRRPRRR